MLKRSTGLLLVAMILAPATLARAEVVVQTVVVGNPGNPDNQFGAGFGGVDYTYQIGTYEVTAEQYTEFLNAVAATDTYGLYTRTMDIDSGLPYSQFGCNIKRFGLSGSFTYSVAPEWASRPVNFVSWGDAARFSNWLHNGQPVGPQGPSTTETGSYLLDGAMGSSDLAEIERGDNATWVIPTEDEWYKAAYHRNDDPTAGYWAYPTSSDADPANDLIEPDPGNSATFFDEGYTIDSPYYRTEAGAHEGSASPYGTCDQGGNVFEWTEAGYPNSFRYLRGGAFNSDVSHLHASHRQVAAAASEFNYAGMRMAMVPEPASVLVLVLSLLGPARPRFERHRA